MPTPFYHLSVACEIVQHPGLLPPVRAALLEHPGEFLFGNTAPDVQVVSGQAREATHFFELPVHPGDLPAWQRLQQEHPVTAGAATLAGPRRVFLAGYMCHLQADWFWVLQIFMPVFGLHSRWHNFPRRLYLHNVLRAHLDREILPALGDGTAGNLAEIHPDAWLPFVHDRHLVVWRDYLAGQLVPGASVQTVDVFAARQGISPHEFYRLLDSSQAMDREIFSHLPRQALDEYRSQLVAYNVAFLNAYLAESKQENRNESD